ncbi:hypothetical protein Tco_1183673 [Tanacetum coccineum]
MLAPGIDRRKFYSTVDACPMPVKLWKAIERLKQGESLMFQDLNQFIWEFGKFTSREIIMGQCPVLTIQLQPVKAMFVTLVKQSQELKTVSYHKLMTF